MRAVLMYHSLDKSKSPISLDPKAFERHLDWIVGNNVRTTNFAEFPLSETNEHVLSLTFDDAFANFADTAWPRLQERNLKATLFVVSSKTGRTNRWAEKNSPTIPELPLLNWDALGKLAEQGCEIACHTKTHSLLTRLSANKVEDEIASCLAEIDKHIGIRPQTLAYPFGDSNESVEKLASRHVKMACTTEFALVDGSIQPMTIPRLDTWYFARPGLFESFGSRRFENFVKRRRFLRRLRRSVPMFRG